MSAEKVELSEKSVNRVLKIVTYAAAYFICLSVSVFGGAVVTVVVYQLTYFETLNDGISFYTFLASVPLIFIFLAWLAVPIMVRLLLKDIRGYK